MNELTNYAVAKGTVNNLETIIQTNKNSILLINNLEIVKQANKTVWAVGNLTYTLRIKNLSSARLQQVIITDILDPTLISLIVESVRINDIPAGYGIISYNQTNGTLRINLPVIDANETIVIHFQVRKKNIEVFKLDNSATISIGNDIALKNTNDMVESNIITVYGVTKVCRCKEIKTNTTK